ncbi:PREDICTED: protein tesmin/TSO1-like CXC 2 [Fragaria vesca subsp. vesca]|uniref:protein tesmin/TSO1-like CXC 2 n=1 Tax=Fragaria vesca subsp. vesca TaxID=101020 RepID=UPI0002C3446A|nr:PREDICTED: protein tesmin/TSO1-like CXC 2 [Fragaria vesca subsp. vesca]XP_011465933.1 PREDICTED: protein tesmin/TSO1-like CXC 2 [Fragaria vesca subsp. vesca]XP_011465934.1 PREDICTED: protein tesmin/TSO1-like CXC 2 [Fragaria vesca subsp. vesca]XP_011465935.1 PREDICTED: protein tesmin/TSO1-like CXC 2 [Fragaria vesca subsp. vesca]
MDTPLKNQSTPLVSVFQESPVSNFISNLSPIEPIKFIRNDHTFNSLSFASPPSGFTPPHIVSPCRNKLLQKRHHFSEAWEPGISRSCNLNSTSDGDSIVSEQLECSVIGDLVPAESLELAAELPSTLKLSCGSPESNVVPFDATKADGTPESVVQSYIHQPKGGHSSSEREAHLLRICRAGFDWEMSVSDADDLLNFDFEIIEENSAEEDPKTGDPGVMSFVSNILVDNHNDVEIRHTADPMGSSEQFALKKFSNSETEYFVSKTVDGGTVSFILDNLQENHNGKELVETVGPIDSSEQCESEKFSTSEPIWDLMEIEQAPSILSRPLLDLNVNPSNTVDVKRHKCTPPSCKPSSQSHTIHRRCLVFDKAETHKRKLVSDSSGTCSVSMRSNCEAPTVVKELIQTTTGMVCAFSSARLPGIGLHLNALATPCETNLTVKTLASESQVMSMPDSKTCYTTITPGEDSRDESLILNYSEDESVACKNGAHLAESTLQTCKHTFEESEHSSPKRKSVETKHVGESRACKRCNCRRSKCLKLYCECFAAGLYCVEPCSCFNCFNKSIHVEIVHETRRLIELRNPLAFAPRVVGSAEAVSQFVEETKSTPTSARHKRGCNCKKSSCLKKYCVCFQGGAGCSLQCKCVGCKNTFGQKGGQRLSGGLGSEDTEVEGESGVHEKNDPMILSEICRSPPDQLPTTDLNRTSEQISLHSSQSSSPRLEKHLQAIPEEETFEALDRPKTSQPSSICVKSASPNSKRVSPPHSHNSIGKFGSLKSWKGGRKLTLRSVPLPFTNL